MFSPRISHISPMRFIPLPQHVSGEEMEAQRGAATFPKHTGSRGDHHPLCCVWGVHSPVELLAQDLLGCGEHLVDTGNYSVVWRLLSWNNGTRDCAKLSILPSLNISMVQASPRDRLDYFHTKDCRETVVSFTTRNHWKYQGLALRLETPIHSGSCTGQRTSVHTRKNILGSKIPWFEGKYGKPLETSTHSVSWARTAFLSTQSFDEDQYAFESSLATPLKIEHRGLEPQMLLKITYVGSENKPKDGCMSFPLSSGSLAWSWHTEEGLGEYHLLLQSPGELILSSPGSWFPW